MLWSPTLVLLHKTCSHCSCCLMEPNFQKRSLLNIQPCFHCLSSCPSHPFATNDGCCCWQMQGTQHAPGALASAFDISWHHLWFCAWSSHVEEPHPSAEALHSSLTPSEPLSCQPERDEKAHCSPFLTRPRTELYHFQGQPTLTIHRWFPQKETSVHRLVVWLWNFMSRKIPKTQLVGF